MIDDAFTLEELAHVYPIPADRPSLPGHVDKLVVRLQKRVWLCCRFCCAVFLCL